MSIASKNEFCSGRGHHYHLKSRGFHEGFTLVELLAVMAIMVFLAVLVIPSLGGLTTAGKFNSTINSLGDTLDLARQTAVARDTYVWVALAVPVSPTDPPLSTIVVASRDGTNPFSVDWSPAVNLATDTRFYLVTKPTSYAQCQFLDAGALTSTQIPSLPSQGNPDTNSLASTLTFTVNSPNNGQIIYKRVIEYTPSGLIYNGLTPVNFVEFGIEPGLVPSATPNKKDVALFRMPFITGKTLLYRP